ncbi:MAG: CinA family protein [Clostridia bacterium]|nr:CinA family protein [Clostridia bacterium]
MKVQEELVLFLKEKNLKIATAESCTGGLLSQMITDVAGASAVFECGVCSYSNPIKMSLLGVKKETIDQYTEVSVQTAEEMAVGVKTLAGADLAVSTTGFAGPNGGTEENPIGTVCMGFALPNGTVTEKKNFNTNGNSGRDAIRRSCAEYCLKRIMELL